jgi:hypothetical protein
MSGQFLAQVGASNAPGYSWVGHTSTGLHRPASNAIAFISGGNEAMRITSTNVAIGGAPSNSPYRLHVTGIVNASSLVINNSPVINVASLSNQVLASSNAAYFSSNALSNYVSTSNTIIPGDLSATGNNLLIGGSNFRIATYSQLIHISEASSVRGIFSFSNNVVANVKIFTRRDVISGWATSFYADYDVAWTLSNTPMLVEKHNKQFQGITIYTEWYYNVSTNTLTLSLQRSQAASYTFSIMTTGTFPNPVISKITTTPAGTLITDFVANYQNNNVGIGKTPTVACDVAGTTNATVVQERTSNIANLYLSSTTSNMINIASNIAFYSSNTLSNMLKTTGGVISGNLGVSNSLTVSGATFTTNSTALTMRDNVVVINTLQTLQGGLEVNRGTGGTSNFMMVFDETTGLFKIGFCNSTQSILTRNDAMTSGYIYFNSNLSMVENQSINASNVTGLVAQSSGNSNLVFFASNLGTWSSNNMVNRAGAIMTGNLLLNSNAQVRGSSTPSLTWAGSTSAGIYHTGQSIGFSANLFVGSNVGLMTTSPAGAFNINLGNLGSCILANPTGVLTNGGVTPSNGGALYLGPTLGSTVLGVLDPTGGLEASWDTVSFGLTRDNSTRSRVTMAYSNVIAMNTSASNRLVVGADGRVGINTTIPSNTLDVRGTAQLGNVQVNGGKVDGVDVSVLNKRVKASVGDVKRCVTTWVSQTAAASNDWETVCWSSELGMFVALAISGTGNRCMTSANGVSWASQSVPDSIWRSVCWSPEVGVFVGVGDTGAVMTSSDGVTWTGQTAAGDTSLNWQAVCWSPELGIFVAVANAGTGNRCMTSPDGITWTGQILPLSPINNVCWSPELGIFVAVGPERAIYSTNGILWTAALGNLGGFWTSVCWSPELGMFVAVARFRSTGGQIMRSTDGINWTGMTAPNTNQWKSVCWSPELSVFVAVAITGSFEPIKIMYSTTGTSWTPVSATNIWWQSVCWSPELSIFVGVGNTQSRVAITPIALPSIGSTIIGTNLKANHSNGNIGIGTLTPSSRLHVEGQTLATTYLAINSSNYSWSNDQDTGVLRPNSNQMSIITGGSRSFNMNSNGCVSIGSSNFTSISSLEITGDMSCTGILLGALSNAQIAIRGTSLGDLTIVNASSSSEQVRLMNAGNMGVGTSNPSASLHVSGNARANVYLSSNDFSMLNARMYNLGSNEFAFTNTMAINSNANIGIGLASNYPYRLTLSSATQQDLRINPDAYNSIVVWDDCRATTGFTGVLSNAVRDTSNMFIELTSVSQSNVGTASWRINPGTSWTLSFEFFSGNGTGGFGTAFNWYSTSADSINGNGYSVFFNEINNTAQILFNGVTLDSWSVGDLDTATWRQVKVIFDRDTIMVNVDGFTSRVYRDSQTRSNMFDPTTRVYFAAVNAFGVTNVHRIRNIRTNVMQEGQWRPCDTSNIFFAGGRVGLGSGTGTGSLWVEGDARCDQTMYAGDSDGMVMLGGTGGDNALGLVTSGFDNNIIVSRSLGGVSNASELLFFKANDVFNNTGPDRVRLRAGGIAFDTYDVSSSNYTEENIRMSIMSNGFVGINTSNPTAMLHIAGTCMTNAYDALGNGTSNIPAYSWTGSSNMGMYRPNSNTLGFVANGNLGMLVNSNGQVSVGGSQASAPLHVTGEMTSTSFSIVSGLKIIKNNIVISPNVGSLAGNSNLYGEGLIIDTGSVTGAYDGGNPNVYGGDGIFKAGSVDIENNANTCIGYGGDVQFYPGYAYVSSTEAGNNRNVESGRMEFYDGDCNLVMLMSNNGRVGIGSSNPSSLCQVAGTITSYTLAATLNASYRFAASPSNIISMSNKAIRIGDFFTVNSNGNIGVSISNPTGRLTTNLSTNSNLHIVLWNSNATTTGFSGFGVNSGVLRYNCPSSTDRHGFFASNVEVAQLAGTGVFNIGMSNVRGGTRVNMSAGDGSNCVIAMTTSNQNAGEWVVGMQSNLDFVVRRTPGNNGCRLNFASPTAWSTFSDARLKDDVVPLERGLNELMRMQPVRFTWKASDMKAVGFIAQDLNAVVPEVVDVPEHDGYYGIRPADILPVIVKAIQEQQGVLARRQVELASLLPV